MAFELGKLCLGLGVLFRFFRPGGRSFALKAVPRAGILTNKKLVARQSAWGGGMVTSQTDTCIRYYFLTGKSVIDSTISQFDPYMNKILGINNENYIDTLLSKKIFSFKINKLSTTDNTFNGQPSDILYTGYLNKDISFGDIVYFESSI